jgi:hypothetical protein
VRRWRDCSTRRSGMFIDKSKLSARRPLWATQSTSRYLAASAFLFLALSFCSSAAGDCKTAEYMGVLRDLVRAQQFSEGKKESAQDQKDLEYARTIIVKYYVDKHHCEALALCSAELSVVKIYGRADNADGTLRALTFAAKLSEEIEPEKARWDYEFKTKGELLYLLIDQGQYQQARPVEKEVAELRIAHDLDPYGLANNLLKSEIHAVARNDMQKAAAYKEAVDILIPRGEQEKLAPP